MTKISKHYDEILLLSKEIKKDPNMSIADLKNKYKDISKYSFDCIEKNIELIKICNEDSIIMIVSLFSNLVKMVNDDSKVCEILELLKV